MAAALSLPAHATAAGLQDCAVVETPGERLACYDAIARDDAAAAAAVGVWKLEAAPSLLNPDWTDYLLWTVAANETQGLGGAPVRPVLLLRCRQREMAVMFDFGAFIGGGAVRIEYRIGSGNVLAGDVTVAPDGRRFGVWQRNRAIGFIKALYGQPQLRLRVTPPTGDSLIAAFDLSGLEQAARPLREGCGWE